MESNTQSHRVLLREHTSDIFSSWFPASYFYSEKQHCGGLEKLSMPVLISSRHPHASSQMLLSGNKLFNCNDFSTTNWYWCLVPVGSLSSSCNELGLGNTHCKAKILTDWLILCNCFLCTRPHRGKECSVISEQTLCQPCLFSIPRVSPEQLFAIFKFRLMPTPSLSLSLTYSHTHRYTYTHTW